MDPFLRASGAGKVNTGLIEQVYFSKGLLLGLLQINNSVRGINETPGKREKNNEKKYSGKQRVQRIGKKHKQ